MSFICPHCEKQYASNYNLQRHINQIHLSDEESDTSEIEEETESENSNDQDGRSENEDSNQISDEENEDTESDSYTFDDVRAILRYALQSSDT